MMPPPLHLSDFCCKCLQYRYQRCHCKQKGANERTNENVYVSYGKILYDSPINKKTAVKFLIYLYEICK